MTGVRIVIPACLIASQMKIGYLVDGQLMVCVLNPLQVFPSATHRLDRELVNNKDHHIFMINGDAYNIRNKGRKCIGFYLVEPLLDALFAKLDTMNLSGISNTDKDMSTLRIGESGKRFNRRLIKGGFEFNRLRFAFLYEIQDDLFVHYKNKVLRTKGLGLSKSLRPLKNILLTSFRRKPESRRRPRASGEPRNHNWIPHQVRNDERGLQCGCAKLSNNLGRIEPGESL